MCGVVGGGRGEGRRGRRMETGVDQKMEGRGEGGIDSAGNLTNRYGS